MAVLADKSIKEGIDGLIGATERVKKYGFIAIELERAKKDYLKSLEQLYNNEDKTESSKYVQGMINNYLSKEPTPGIANRYKFALQEIDSIKITDINLLATKMQTDQGKFAILMSSEINASKLPNNKDLIKMLQIASRQTVVPYEEKVLTSTLMDKTPVAGKIIYTKYIDSLGIVDYTLSNFVSVYIKSTNFKDDEILMDAWRLGGSHNYPLADKNNAQYAAQLVNQMGVKNLTPTDLNKVLSGKSVNVQPYINAYEEGIQGTTNKKDMESFFQLIHLYFTEPRKDKNLFKSFITTNKSIYKNVKDDPMYFYADSIIKLQYANNPWAESIPMPSNFDGINLDSSFNIYNEIFSNAFAMHYTFVGNIDTNKIKPLIELYLGSLSSNPVERKYTDEGLRPLNRNSTTIINKGKEKQSIVTISYTGEFKYELIEIIKLKMLSDILNIKIIEKLREQMSGIYGGGSSVTFNKRPYEHYEFTISFPCAPENVDKLTYALMDLISDIKKSGSAQIDLVKVKEAIIKKNGEELKTNGYWLEMLSQIWINEESLNTIAGKMGIVKSITDQDIKITANKYLNNNQIKVILNPEKIK